jgi:hypothetical protein
MKKAQSWRDDGVNMQEWLAVAYFLPWLVIGCLFAWKAYSVGLLEVDVDFFYILSWPTLLTACFYYGFKVILNLGRKAKNETLPKINQLPDQLFDQEQNNDWRNHV